MNQLSVDIEIILKTACEVHQLVEPHAKRAKELTAFIDNNAAIQAVINNIGRKKNQAKKKYKSGMFSPGFPAYSYTKDAAILLACEKLASIHNLVHKPLIRDNSIRETSVAELYAENKDLFQKAVDATRAI